MENRDERVGRAMEAFFAAHAEDPRLVEREGREVTWSVFYHERMLAWLDRVAPEAGDSLRLAAGSQHIRRWRKPREEYPEGKLGYKQWRRDLGVFHGEEAGAILERAGFEAAAVERVKDLLAKKGLGEDPDTQALEDVACLVFLENQLAEFAGKHAEEKVVSIIRKTWAKMSERGRAEALVLAKELPAGLRELVLRATGGGGEF